MDVLEQKLKDYILSRYKSIREFALNIEMPYSTIDTILKRGINKASVGNILKICQSLGISADALADGEITETDKERDLIHEPTFRNKLCTVSSTLHIPFDAFEDFFTRNTKYSLHYLRKLDTNELIDFFSSVFQEDKSSVAIPSSGGNNEREISHDLDKLIEEIKNAKEGPLYYKGEPLDEKHLELLSNALELALNEVKKRNKVVPFTKEYFEPQAAHERTDIEVTDEMRKTDDDIMDDNDFWK